tara:strand:+ start:209 stop:1987 length:1779 start_codon:yes stop_codon:yes gene_type:complete
MSRNRISYNIEDVFVGSPPGETSEAITGVTGNGLNYQILQRLNKIQSFDYSFDIPKEPVTVLGRTHSEFEERTAPASVNIDFSYLSDGINNEERMGFSVQKQQGQYPDSVSIPFVSGLMDKTADKRNIYLAIKGQGEGDIHEYSTGDYAFPPTGFAFMNVQDVASPTAGDQDYIVFQNCYYNRYDVTFGVGELATVNIGAVADNAIFQKGLTTGVGIPYINTQTAETGFSGVSLVVPKYINPNNSAIANMPQVIRPAHINVSVTKDPKRVYASRFAVELDPFGFTASNGTNTYTASYGGLSSVLRFNGDTTNSIHAMHVKSLGMEIGKRYRIKGKFYVDTAGGNFKGINIYNDTSYYWLRYSSAPTSSSQTKINLGEWVEFDSTITALKDELHFYALSSAGTAFAATTADNFGIKDIVITEEEFVEFTNDSVQSCDISLDLSREPITYLGHKLYADRQLQTPIDFSVGFDYVVSGHQSGNMMDNFNKTEKYNVNIDFITGNLLAMNYKASGLNLESVGTTSSIGSNKSSSVAFRGQFDLDEQKRGFFVSGSVISLGIITFASGRRGSVVIYPTDDAGNLLTDDRSEFLYPRY